MAEAKPLTIGEYLNFLAPGVWEDDSILEWPPDVFALCASLLERSEAYCLAVDGEAGCGKALWIQEIKNLGAQWCVASGQEVFATPPDLGRLWREITGARDVAVAELRQRERRELAVVILRLACAADQAADGAGLAHHDEATGSQGSEAQSRLVKLARRLLHVSNAAAAGATLCRPRVDATRVRVLPKLHTPQSGITLRSLSHHLALCAGGAVVPRWRNVNWAFARRAPSLNLLVLPWPLEIRPVEFRGFSEGDAKHHGFFSFEPSAAPAAEVAACVERLIDAAVHQVGRVDGVVLPEMALDVSQEAAVRQVVLRRSAFLIAGVREPGEGGGPGLNLARFSFPVLSLLATSTDQNKHHRWRLDRRQIRQYGLSSLDPSRQWWEHIAIGERQLEFLALSDWGTISVLICEDLARQEPVTEMVRAVGPNLVIALLMDGPQLPGRWSARYATVLSDDPGCSVLSITSLGMARLSRSEEGKLGSRVVALWKDDVDGRNVSLEMPPEAQGVVVSLARERKTEWSADGREGPGRAYFPTLIGYHFVKDSI